MVNTDFILVGMCGLTQNYGDIGAFKAPDVSWTQIVNQCGRTTLNRTDNPTLISYLNENLTATKNPGPTAYENTLSTTFKSSGQWYFRITLVAQSTTNTVGLGIANSSAPLTAKIGSDVNGLALYNNAASASQFWTNNANASATGPVFNVGDTLGFAVNFDLRLMWVENVTQAPGVWNNGGTNNPVSFVGGFDFSATGGNPVQGAWFIAASLDTVADSITLNVSVAGPSGYGAWDDGTMRAGLFYKIAGPSEPNPTFTWASPTATSHGARWFSAAYVAPNPLTPVQASASSAYVPSTTNAVLAPTINIPIYGDWLLNVYFSLGNRAAYLGDPLDNLRVDSHGTDEREGGIVLTDNAPAQFDPARTSAFLLPPSAGPPGGTPPPGSEWSTEFSTQFG